jgi:predicted dehydrogenase
MLAAKFREAGAKIIAYDRLKNSFPQSFPQSFYGEGFGERLPWQLMLSNVDAIVAAAPPDITLAVTRAAAEAGVPVFATKPLMLEQPLTLKAALFVDYVKLWSPRWQSFKRAQTLITDVEIEFYGDGPVRSFPGLLDYGSHALAYVQDLLGTQKLDIRTARVSTKRADGSHIVTANAIDNGVPVTITTGNGATSRRRRVTVNGSAVYDDDPYEDPLTIMVREFIEHVRAGRADTRLMLLTCAVTASLNKIQSACALRP